jgi:hypothetical protein
VAGDHLLIRDDHVLADMLARLGAEVSRVTAPFVPEGGAYGHGRTHGHSHGPSDTGPTRTRALTHERRGRSPDAHPMAVPGLPGLVLRLFPRAGGGDRLGRGERRATAAEWIATVIEAGSGRTDAILLAAALRGADLEALSDDGARAGGLAERWEETRAQGAAFAATRRAMGAGWPTGPIPVAVGEGARELTLAPETVVSLYLQAFAGALVSASVRFVPLGQARGSGFWRPCRADRGGGAWRRGAGPGGTRGRAGRGGLRGRSGGDGA